ncbi:hypothetical protein BC628DRAFT_509561 [Trametes gibbosa]|nr:hypothetical protein BC628DRAFT_509561 [Trametes gibbosa]
MMSMMRCVRVWQNQRTALRLAGEPSHAPVCLAFLRIGRTNRIPHRDGPAGCSDSATIRDPVIVAPSCQYALRATRVLIRAQAGDRERETSSPHAWRCARWSGMAAADKTYFRSGPLFRRRGHARPRSCVSGTAVGVRGGSRRRGVERGAGGQGRARRRRGARWGNGRGGLVDGGRQRRSATRSRQGQGGSVRAHSPVSHPPPAISAPPRRPLPAPCAGPALPYPANGQLPARAGGCARASENSEKCENPELLAAFLAQYSHCPSPPPARE